MSYHTAPVANHPELTYRAEMSLACTYALRRPALAIKCAFAALRAAVAMGRPDLAHSANALLSVI